MEKQLVVTYSVFFMLLHLPVALQAKRMSYQTLAPSSKQQLLRYGYIDHEKELELTKKKEIYNYRARTYDPKLRQFLSPDKAKTDYGAYVYVMNNPVSYVDLTGNAPNKFQLAKLEARRAAEMARRARKRAYKANRNFEKRLEQIRANQYFETYLERISAKFPEIKKLDESSYMEVSGQLRTEIDQRLMSYQNKINETNEQKGIFAEAKMKTTKPNNSGFNLSVTTQQIELNPNAFEGKQRPGFKKGLFADIVFLEMTNGEKYVIKKLHANISPLKISKLVSRELYLKEEIIRFNTAHQILGSNHRAYWYDKENTMVMTEVDGSIGYGGRTREKVVGDLINKYGIFHGDGHKNNFISSNSGEILPIDADGIQFWFEGNDFRQSMTIDEYMNKFQFNNLGELVERDEKCN